MEVCNMNMKKIVRKVVAIGTGAAMVGATLMGAMATNLNEYPAPFVQDGVFDAVLVIGDQAQGFDNIGLTDIAMALQASSYVEETVETSEGTTTVSDGVVED
ncbi:MAG: S-layer protein, partial [Nanoarchaeota archaeon]|nr:S-layer protein [Nanoarchaeota archaeon]